MSRRWLFPWVARGFVLVFALVSVARLHADLGKLSLEPLLRAWSFVLLATLLSVLNYLLRIVRWRTYLARLGHQLPFTFTALTYAAGFAFTLSPAKLGELARASYYQSRGVPLAQVAGSFLIERLMDLLATTVLAAMILASSASYHAVLWIAAGLIGVALCLLALIPWAKLVATADTAAAIPRALQPLLKTTSSGLAAAQRLLRPDLLAFGFALGVLAWGLEGVGLGVLASTLPGPQLALGAAVGIYAVALLAGALSLLPGGLGGTEAVMTALLAAHGLPLAGALLVTIVCRLVTLWLAVGLGWGAVWALRQQPRALVPSWQ